MIFRAIFWIGLVALLMPHEPDLGFGRPGAHADTAGRGFGSLPSANLQKACADHATVCAGSLSFLDSFQAVAARSLDEVRADIDAHRRTAHSGI